MRISARSLCGAPDLRNLTVVFLGPRAYVGSGGAGDEVPKPYRAVGGGFEVDYRLPRSYVAGDGNSSTSVAVTPGAGYSFSTYPAGGCTARFTVSAR